MVVDYVNRRKKSDTINISLREDNYTNTITSDHGVSRSGIAVGLSGSRGTGTDGDGGLYMEWQKLKLGWGEGDVVCRVAATRKTQHWAFIEHNVFCIRLRSVQRKI
ncbi:hypothetical protein Tco_0734181, partial [Tanacetum coccineum]